MFIFFIVGLWFDSLNVVRQYLAIAVWLFAYPFMRDRKPVPYLLISGLAFLLHPTSVVLLPLYVLYGIRLDRRRFIAVGGILAAGAVLACWLMPAVLAYIPKYSRYVAWSPDPELAGTVFAISLTSAVLVLFSRLPEGEHTGFLLWSLLLYDSLVLLSWFLPQMGRVMLYFEIPVFVNLIPCLLSAVPRARKTLTTCAVMGSLLCTTLYMNYHLDHSDVFPYQSVFEVERMEDYLGEIGDVLLRFRHDYARN